MTQTKHIAFVCPYHLYIPCKLRYARMHSGTDNLMMLRSAKGTILRSDVSGKVMTNRMQIHVSMINYESNLDKFALQTVRNLHARHMYFPSWHT